MKTYFLLDTGERISLEEVPSSLSCGLPMGCIDVHSDRKSTLWTIDQIGRASCRERVCELV